MRNRGRGRKIGRLIAQVGVSGPGAPPVFVTAEVGLSGVDILVILFDVDVSTTAPASQFVLNASGGAVAVVFLVPITHGFSASLDRTIVNGETLTLDYTPGDVKSVPTNGLLVAFTGKPVTNNVP